MSARLADVMRSAAADAQRLRVADLLQLHGEGSGAILLILMALISTLPVAGAGTVVSLGILALAWAWLRGRDSMELPQALGDLTLNERWSQRSLHTLAWIYERADAWLRPRWRAICHDRTRVWWGVWMALMAALIFLPLPLGNVLPGTSLILMSLGWMFRDGLVLLLSTATGAAGVGYALSMGHLAVEAWRHLSGWWPW